MRGCASSSVPVFPHVTPRVAEMIGIRNVTHRLQSIYGYTAYGEALRVDANARWLVSMGRTIFDGRWMSP